MAAPLSKEDKAEIVNYLKQQSLSDLTGVKIKELVKENFGINISQPTASKLKGDILGDNTDYWKFAGDESSLKRPTLSKRIGAMAEPTKPDKIRQLSQEQLNAIEHMLQGQGDRVIAEILGLSLQTILEWRNNDPLFIAELNRLRVELWSEARDRLKSLANRALDVWSSNLTAAIPRPPWPQPNIFCKVPGSWAIPICH